MKRKPLLLALVASLLLSACALPTKPDAQGGTKTYTYQEIEARINKMEENYDGLYVFDPELYKPGMVMTAMENTVEDAIAVESPKSADVETERSMTPIDSGIFDKNREGYNETRESGFVSTTTQPFSTFGADVDTATYSNIRRMIFEDKPIRDPSFIRAEEMINYFNYDYGTPEPGEKFKINTILAPCPWNKHTLVLQIGIRAEDSRPNKGSNIVFLVDTSGSMFDNNKLPLAQKALNILKDRLTENDTVSIVTYA